MRKNIFEIFAIFAVAIGFIGGVLQLLILAITRSKTPTHLYIGYITVLWMLAQFFNPIFYDIYASNLSLKFNISYVLMFFFLLLIFGQIIVFVLLFLIDYCQWIGTYKIVVIITHTSLLLVIGFLRHFIVGRQLTATDMSAAVVITWVTFFIILLIHLMDSECLVRRRQSDGESKLRHSFVLTFMVTKMVVIVLFVFEYIFLTLLAGWMSFGFISIGLYHLDPVVLLLVLLKVDKRTRLKLMEFFKMCYCCESDRAELQNLQLHNGGFSNQNV